MLRWVQVSWQIFQLLWLTFGLVLLVEEIGSKLKGPVIGAVSDRSTMSAHCIYIYKLVCGLVEIGCVVDKYCYLRNYIECMSTILDTIYYICCFSLLSLS